MNDAAKIRSILREIFPAKNMAGVEIKVDADLVNNLLITLILDAKLAYFMNFDTVLNIIINSLYKAFDFKIININRRRYYPDTSYSEINFEIKIAYTFDYQAETSIVHHKLEGASFYPRLKTPKCCCTCCREKI